MTWQLSAFSDEAGATADEQIEAAIGCGLKKIDLRSVDGYNVTQLPVDNARQLRKKIDSAGLKVAMFGSPIGKIDIADEFAPELDRLRHLGELAPILGCARVRLFSYYNARGASPEAWWSETLSRLRELRALAKELGLTLWHENEANIYGDASKDVLRLADALREPEGAFRMIFDFDNFAQNGEDVWAAWELLSDRTDWFHLKDSAAKEHVPAGEGDGQIERVLRDAAARGWQGGLSIEPHLSFSAAVMATGPGGAANAAYSGMPLPQSFAVACSAATALLARTGAAVD